jgi:F-box/leucine-rich repeat protein 2/20
MADHTASNGHAVVWRRKAREMPILDGGCPISALPQDLLLRIFSFLDVVSLCRTAQVSRLWHDLALHGSNWQCVDLFEFQMAIEVYVVEQMSRRCGGFLRKLSLRDCQTVGDAALEKFCLNCPHLEKLILSKCVCITDRSAESLSKNCPNLLYLNMSSCRAITNDTCRHISSGCHKLEHIDVSYCDVLVEGVELLVKGCPGLRHIMLTHCREVGPCVVM